MKRLLFGTVSLLLLGLAAGCSTTSQAGKNAARLTEPTVVQAACGECLFGMKGKGCDLAVRIDGRAYYVDGVNMDSLGDAHAADGMCQVIRKARVTGEVRHGRFVATHFELLPSAGQ